MAETAASTAYGPMMMVALEATYPPAQRIMEDTLAYDILPTFMKLMVKACYLKPARQVFDRLMDQSLPGLHPVFVCRKRYIHDAVVEAAETGIDSLVLLGAGMDTLAYRLPQLADKRVYEVDLPDNIAYKRQKLVRLFGAVPAHVTLVPLDFETQRLDDALEQHGFDIEGRTVFVWEAVTQYLTEQAVRDTLQCLSKAGAGSRLIFTYVLQDFIAGENLYGLEAAYKRWRVRNDLWHFGLAPAAVAAFIGEYGWRLVEDIGSDSFAVRYLASCGRSGPVAEIERIACAEKQMSR